VVRPRGLPEAVVALPTAALVLALGVLPLHVAAEEAHSLGPTIGLLAAVLVLAAMAERDALFAAALLAPPQSRSARTGECSAGMAAARGKERREDAVILGLA
jgi:arsenical pump membrane protein